MAENQHHPQRVKARTVKGYKAVHRPTRWGNPFPIPLHSREESLRLYERWLDQRIQEEPCFLEPLRGFDVGCFCRIDEPCHGDILLRKLYGRVPNGGA